MVYYLFNNNLQINNEIKLRIWKLYNVKKHNGKYSVKTQGKIQCKTQGKIHSVKTQGKIHSVKTQGKIH